MHAHDLKTGGNGSLVKLRGVHVLAQIFEMWQFWHTLYECAVYRTYDITKNKMADKYSPHQCTTYTCKQQHRKTTGGACTPTICEIECGSFWVLARTLYNYVQYNILQKHMTLQTPPNVKMVDRHSPINSPQPHTFKQQLHNTRGVHVLPIFV